LYLEPGTSKNKWSQAILAPEVEVSIFIDFHKFDKGAGIYIYSHGDRDDFTIFQQWICRGV